ncbi:MAG: outer membrane protein assembly factor BamD [Desulfovibrionaceae bacterium]|nr:outer membrane protein assembly factor BamD [Desulfovibrionaceae bacterium]
MRSLCIFIIFICTLFLGCAAKEEPVLPLEVLYEQGTQAMQQKKYKLAVKAFKAIRDHYPFSQYAEEAILNLSDSYFLSNQFLQAADSYKEFEMLYPRHKVIPYVMYQIGFCYQSLFISVDREIDSLVEAKGYYQKLIDIYPNSNYGTKAKEQILTITRKLAERDIYLANFYWRTERYGAAYVRYTEVIEKYPELQDIATYAKKQATISYLKFMEQQAEQAQDEGRFQFKDLFQWL